MGVDGSALEAEVVVILKDLLVDGGMVDGDRCHGDLGSCGAFGGEETPVDVVVEGCWDDIAVGGNELDTGLVERECGVAVVGDDDADGNEAVLHVFEAEEAAIAGIVTRLGGDGDVLVGMSVEGGVLIGRFGWRGFFVGCKSIGGNEASKSYYCAENLWGRVGLHGQVDYHLRWCTR